MESLLEQFQNDMTSAVRSMVTRARQQLQEMKQSVEEHNAQALAALESKRTQGLAEVAEQRAQGLAEVAAKRTALEEEVAAMLQVEHAQDSRVKLNVGGVRYETSIATLRSTPGTMLDAMFSGRHAMDPDDSDGAHFLDRDGGHF